MKIFTDTLQSNGKWSQKRIMVFTSFFIASVYGFMPAFIANFDVKEFVFLGFMGAGGFTLYRIQKKNENIPADDSTEENN
jgi:hypothetical protein